MTPEDLTRSNSLDHPVDAALDVGSDVPGLSAGDAAKLIGRYRRRRHRLGVIGAALFLSVAIFAIVGPWLIPHDPNAINLRAIRLPPWSTVDGVLHVLGTDSLGRDQLARLAAGTRASLTVVLASLVIGGSIGLTLGVMSGYKGGATDGVVMRLVDAQLALPTTIFAMLVAGMLGVGFTNTAIAIGFASWPIYARLLRAEVLRVREREHILVARTLGISTLRLIRVHILPNVMGALAVVGTLELGRMIIIESTLSFVGLGMQLPNASLGSMVRQGQEYVFTAWWLATAPGLMIMISVLGLNLMGDWVRDILDPRSK